MKINIARQLKKFVPILLKAREDKLNEADTSQRVFKVFEEILGYNPYEEISKELEIREKYADFAVKIDANIKFLVEIKPAAAILRLRHVEQCERYASEKNIQWVLLTNGVDWNLYHLTFGQGIEYETAFSITLTLDTIEEAAELIGLLHRSSVRSGGHDAYWKQRSALSPKALGKALFFQGTLMFIRREIRRNEGILIDTEDLATAIHELFDCDTREKMGTPKIRNRRLAKKPAQGTETCVDVAKPIPTATVATPEDGK